MLKFVEKKGLGCHAHKYDVSITFTFDNRISFSETAIDKICGGGMALGVRIAIQEERMYFVPSNARSLSTFILANPGPGGKRRYIVFSKGIADIDEFLGKYDLIYDEEEEAYYIDRNIPFVG